MKSQPGPPTSPGDELSEGGGGAAGKRGALYSPFRISGWSRRLGRHRSMGRGSQSAHLQTRCTLFRIIIVIKLVI